MKLILVVDGGTTNLRVTAVDAGSHEPLSKAGAEGGVKHTAIDGDNHRLKEMLRDCIARVLSELSCTNADVVRCIAFGMITSGMGLYEIPHLIAPAGIRELHEGMKAANFPEIAPFDIEFIPGVRNFSGNVDIGNCAGMDIMRGEEVESIGLYTRMKPAGNALLVLPGSHNKFVKLDAGGHILGCKTSISGELLDVITHGTILADAVGHSFCSGETYDREYALGGAAECAASGLGRAAFAGRILRTLGTLPQEKVQSWLLGAVLMEDVRALRDFADAGTAVYVAGKPPLQQAFYDVLEAEGSMKPVCVDPALSAGMGLCGALSIAEIQ